MQNLSESLPTTFYELMSTPIWHNRFLGTKFNCELSGIGFNFVRDIVSEGKIITKDHFSIQNLKYSNKRQLDKIGNTLDNRAMNLIEINSDLNYAINPASTSIMLKESPKCILELKAHDIYNKLIEKKLIFQLEFFIGVINWISPLMISLNQLN